jgi:transcriptional regulator with XRE-family HTH domain
VIGRAGFFSFLGTAAMKVDHEAVVEALRAGESQKAVARRLGCGFATVNRIAKRYGAVPAVPRTVEKSPAVLAAEQAAADYSLERRMALLNKVFAQAEQMIETATTPHKLQALAIALGILIDKRRLEDGEATARTEVNGGDARERIARRLDELAARRREKGAA